MIAIGVLLALWLGLATYGVRRWQHALVETQRDAQLKALLGGSLVPGPRVPGLRPPSSAPLASTHGAQRTGATAAG